MTEGNDAEIPPVMFQRPRLRYDRVTHLVKYTYDNINVGYAYMLCGLEVRFEACQPTSTTAEVTCLLCLGSE